ncbi:MAG TPA: right-handed parallel beta-helix repeat-containing protein [Dehalococcoidia bacterium]|nr:right-handed parallel beta-helix repeat-containing protein [Dehalococcoidia bacterium]
MPFGSLPRQFSLIIPLVALVVGCGDDEADQPEGVLVVPGEEYETLQEAVDEAEPGDLVLVLPGVYEESVTVETEHLVIRGADRNEVILDGGFELANGIIVEADGVAIENMTARRFTANGFIWSGVEGYRASYLTAHNNGVYGINVFDSRSGLIEHSYASGSADAGIYIGECRPCDAVVRNVTGEYNGFGYAGLNASENITLIESTFRFNRVGIFVGTFEEREDLGQQGDAAIVGNLVYSNNNSETSAVNQARLGEGNGIMIYGGRDNVIERNRVFDHELGGISLVQTFGDEAWFARGNRVAGNVVADSGTADLIVVGGGGDNCTVGNELSSSIAVAVETLSPCADSDSSGARAGALGVGDVVLRDIAPTGNYQDQPEPGPQPQMPDALSGRWQAAGNPPTVDLADVVLPPEQ